MPKDYFQNELNKPLKPDAPDGPPDQGEAASELPEVTPVTAYSVPNTPPASPAPAGQSVPPPPSQQQGGSPASGGAVPQNTANYSALIPAIEGSLFVGGRAQTSASPGTPPDQYPYAAYSPPGAASIPYGTLTQAPADQWANQNAQAEKRDFANSAAGGAVSSGYFLGEDSLWMGTIVQGVLETGINTDLPGNVIARVTQNVYDSRTGKKLLIPQGTLLIAKYNSSISYAQNRVQIVWNTLIRPDGFYIELEGMPAVDKQGMSGQEARYHENWFEYVKAAGIIAMFSVASSKMADESAKYASGDVQEGIVAGNAEFVNQIGGNIVSKAMNIQPTLTVESATLINIMLNKTIYLPPVKN